MSALVKTQLCSVSPQCSATWKKRRCCYTTNSEDDLLQRIPAFIKTLLFTLISGLCSLIHLIFYTSFTVKSHFFCFLCHVLFVLRNFESCCEMAAERYLRERSFSRSDLCGFKTRKQNSSEAFLQIIGGVDWILWKCRVSNTWWQYSEADKRRWQWNIFHRHVTHFTLKYWN